jgi:small GTP-binding protein
MSDPPAVGERRVKAKICLVGDIAVGKTSLVKRYVLDTFDDRYVATIGTKVVKRSVEVAWRGAMARMDLVIWDIMGERGFRQLLKEAYFEGAQGILAVCDVTRRDTLFDLNGWMQLARKRVGSVPVAFLGNKVDLEAERNVSDEELARLAGVYDAEAFPTSAKTGANVERAFRCVAEAIAATWESPHRQAPGIEADN